MKTYDRLADPKARTIQTTWTLDESTKDGQIVLTLETAVSKRRGGQYCVTDIYVQNLTSSPYGSYLTRSFTLFEASVGAGIDLIVNPMPRYNQKNARFQHEEVLARLSSFLDECVNHKAYPEMRRLLDLALVSA